MNRIAMTVSACLLAALPAAAGEFNKKLNIGDPPPAFANLPGTDGKNHSLADFKDSDVVVIAVTSNECIVSIAYEDRIIALAKKYAGKVAFVAISVSLEDDDKLPAM